MSHKIVISEQSDGYGCEHFITQAVNDNGDKLTMFFDSEDKAMAWALGHMKKDRKVSTIHIYESTLVVELSRGADEDE